jgi:hypothetical protein
MEGPVQKWAESDIIQSALDAFRGIQVGGGPIQLALKVGK